MARFKTFIAILISLTSTRVFAQQTVSLTDVSGWQARITEIRSKENPGISFLKWDELAIWVEENQGNSFTVLKGHLSQPTNQLTLNGKNVYVNDSGDFEIRFGFKGREKSFRLLALNPNNQVYRAQFRLAPPHRALNKNSALDTETLDFKLSRFRYSIGVGYTAISFEQSNLGSFDEKAITVKGSILYRLSPNRWDLGVSAFYNAAVLSSTSEYQIKYLGVNLRAGYHLIDSYSRFKLIINGGVYFNDSYSDVGFENMIGPQIYPELAYVFANGNSLMGYAKFSPSLTQTRSISLHDNHEIAAGIHYSFPLNLDDRMSLGFDYSQLKLSNDTDAVKTSTLSFSAGLSF